MPYSKTSFLSHNEMFKLPECLGELEMNIILTSKANLEDLT